ncbi:helix-hairpin-helix domain-containing protein [Nostoc sp. CHAB 5836]|uniref:ComEA family DNA-binding protein n=1 Tax=Nostoc sp. CHAB 5836 TaxID=2780404 RepID=UPI001E4C2914|nr:helix-hairpin-helix domain-containing protein [Nostoc sp. CHAB 5836]MCC5616373.1 helix-hairpin-helix domain-containing protein [Nostoc sp. CHAB 5836]
MTIDPNQPVTLKKHSQVKGNLYHPREYKPGELPSELLTEEYVTQGSPEVPTFSPFAGSFEETKVIIGAETPNNELTSYQTSTVIVPTPVTRIQINEATIEAIATLEGIGLIAAKKVVEERVKSPFTSLEDLKARVPLGKTLKWETFTDRLLFDNTLVEQKTGELPTSGII